MILQYKKAVMDIRQEKASKASRTPNSGKSQNFESIFRSFSICESRIGRSMLLLAVYVFESVFAAIWPRRRKGVEVKLV